MILIVDDDRAIRLSVGLMLRQGGYEYVGVSTEKEALAHVRGGDVELVLLDMNLTLSTDGRQGIEMLRKIKILLPEVPVILISAWGTIPLAVEGLKFGAVDFVTKPWSNRDLLSKIRKALSRAEEAREQAKVKPLDDMERQAIRDALNQSEGNMSQAAEALGITRQSLYRRMEKYNIKP